MPLQLARQVARLVWARAHFSEGSRIEINKAMIETTTSSSTSVNPCAGRKRARHEHRLAVRASMWMLLSVVIRHDQMCQPNAKRKPVRRDARATAELAALTSPGVPVDRQRPLPGKPAGTPIRWTLFHIAGGRRAGH
jgi:hypothetical protein